VGAGSQAVTGFSSSM